MKEWEFKITRKDSDREISFKARKDELEIESWDGNNDDCITITLTRQEWWTLTMWMIFNFKSG